MTLVPWVSMISSGESSKTGKHLRLELIIQICKIIGTSKHHLYTI